MSIAAAVNVTQVNYTNSGGRMMYDEQDIEEFMQTASAEIAVDIGDGKGLVNDQRSEKRRERAEKRLGGLRQYAALGEGFSPTTDTIKTLAPDCYTLTMTMEGSIIFLPQKLVTDNLLRLPDSKSEAVIQEVERFWTLKDKFRKYGFAHKRGFLLWGPPGSGKTSTVAMIIADMVTAGGIVLLADHPGFLAKALMQFRAIESERPLVVIWEDIDTVIANFGESSVLSILDGEAQVENVVFIATTNYPERLDGRVINRPSRFDKIVKIGMPNAEARKMFLMSKIETTEKDGIDLVKATEGLSIAHLKELVISTYCQETPVNEVLDRLQKMKNKPKSDSEAGGPIGFR